MMYQFPTRSQNHFFPVKAVMLCAMMTLAISASPCAAFEDGWQPWQPDTEIAGIGAIYKDTPVEENWLHWNRNDGGEQATFHITKNNPEDYDRRDCYLNNHLVDFERVNFGLAATEDWRASAGTITSAGVYTPPAAVNSAVTIDCWITDGNGGYHGEQQHRVWEGETLKIFKVGVAVAPAGVTIWEDDATATHEWTKYANGLALETSLETTYWDDAGNYPSPAAGWALDATWTVVTQPEHAPMMGETSYTPSILANGRVLFQGHGDGFNSTGCTMLCTIVAAAGRLLPPPATNYVRAGASVTSTLMGAGSDLNFGFAADAAIQYVAASGDEFKKENLEADLLDPRWDTVGEIGNLSSFINCSGTASTKEGVTRHGSARAAAEVAIRDASVLMYHAGRIMVDPCANPGPFGFWLKYGVSRPAYVKP